MTDTEISPILEDEYLVSLAQTFVVSSKDSFEEMMERIAEHQDEIPEIGNIALFSILGNFFDEFCYQIQNGNTNLLIVIFEAAQAVMNDENFVEFNQKMALNPFAALAGLSDFGVE